MVERVNAIAGTANIISMVFIGVVAFVLPFPTPNFLGYDVFVWFAAVMIALNLLLIGGAFD